MRLLATTLAAFLLVACNNGGPLGPGEQRELREAQRRWTERGPAHYVMEHGQSCFCPTEITRWARVEVRDGRVVRATLVDSGEELPPQWRDERPTVDELFRILREERSDWLDQVTASYDAELGYPRRIEFRSKPQIADAGFTHEIRSLEPLP